MHVTAEFTPGAQTAEGKKRTVKAIVIDRHGGPDVLQLKDVEIGPVGRGQALVRPAMAGVNFVDIYQRRGTYPKPLPFTPGQEGAGIVEEVGKGVTVVKPGDRVAYTGQPGAYAEACLVRADSLIPLPLDLSFELGAAFPLQGMTAHYLMHEFRKPTADSIVLVHAAAGGMGLLLVQWAGHFGARVVGTVSNDEKARAARQAGATDIILYTHQDFVAETKRLTNEHGADLIIDGVGKLTFTGNLEAAALRGHIIVFGASSGPADPIVPNSLMARSLSVSGGTLQNYLRTRDELLWRANDVIASIEHGWLKLRIFRVLPLAEAAEAHRLLESRQSIGKILLSTGVVIA
jgi:NADPH2:quinone reductase